MKPTTPTILAVAISLLSGATAFAQATPPAAPAAPMWLMSCSNRQDPAQLVCELSQSIVLTQGNQRVATASFARVAGQTRTNANFILPVGVLLPAGVTVAVDGNRVGEAIYQSCDADGCYATADVGDAWLKAMRAGETLTLGLKAQDGQAVDFGFQLDGFTTTEAMLP
ncbi:invasion associated locus B family protein [Tropicimonas sp. IMCC34043]|uniref:invasion associated locus B family protein n=1 Tax=Tropicimonas sp. IMCC34043 TaxID=2248760 RepID=UPI000E230283|nr:invasion associated locus B family protein [Tropicimonas sp. IMCC34043]